MKKGVIGILFKENNTKVLLIQRRDTPVWVLPGGGIDPGEEPETAIIREFFEETGLRVQVKRLVGHYTPQNKLASETYFFECTPTGESSFASSHSDETLHCQFFDIEHLPHPFFFLHEEWIKDALKGEKAPIRRPITSITWLQLAKQLLLHPILVIRYFLSRFGFPVNKKK